MATDPQDLVRRLVQRLEAGPSTLHRYASAADMCRRLSLGLGASGPEGGDCGLDSLLAEALAFTGDRQCPKPAHFYEEPSRRSRLGNGW